MTSEVSNCAICGERLDFSRATIVVEPGEPSYQPFGEDWRGGRVRMAHPRCFIERDGVDRFLELLAKNEQRQRERL